MNRMISVVLIVVLATGSLALCRLGDRGSEPREAARRGAMPTGPGPALRPSDPGAPEPLPIVATETPADLRELIRFANDAGPGERLALRRMALESPDPLVAGNAIGALGRLDAIASDVELIELIDDPRPRVRQEIARALGRSSDPSLADVLAGRLADEPPVRLLAIQALGRLGGTRAHEVLTRVSEAPDSSETERAFVRQALSELARPRRVAVRESRAPGPTHGRRLPVDAARGE